MAEDLRNRDSILRLDSWQQLWPGAIELEREAGISSIRVLSPDGTRILIYKQVEETVDDPEIGKINMRCIKRDLSYCSKNPDTESELPLFGFHEYIYEDGHRILGFNVMCVDGDRTVMAVYGTKGNKHLYSSDEVPDLELAEAIEGAMPSAEELKLLGGPSYNRLPEKIDMKTAVPRFIVDMALRPLTGNFDWPVLLPTANLN